MSILYLPPYTFLCYLTFAIQLRISQQNYGGGASLTRLDLVGQAPNRSGAWRTISMKATQKLASELLSINGLFPHSQRQSGGSLIFHKNSHFWIRSSLVPVIYHG